VDFKVTPFLVKVVDFGLAKEVDHASFAESTLGTLPYMAP